MADMNLKERAEVVRAMDTMVRCINYMDIIDAWFMNGVADGDIDENTTDEDLDIYCDDKTFKELMTLFLKLMNRACADGIYCDGVVSGTKTIKWE